MSTLTGSLPDSPFCGCEGSDAPPLRDWIRLRRSDPQESWLRERREERVLANLAMIAITGAVGFCFIDNAGHAGGVAAGMIVGAASAGARRISQRSVRAVDTCGSVAAAILAAAAVFTAGRLMHAW